MGQAVLKLKVEETESGERLDKFILNKSEANSFYSRQQIQNLIKNNGVTIDGTVIAKCSYKLHPSQEVCLALPESPPSRAATLPVKAADFNIIYQDNDLIVIDKPAGLTVHPGKGNYDNTLVNGLLYTYGQYYLEEEPDNENEAAEHQSQAERPGIVHRLDKDTSGLLIVARHPEALSLLSQQFANRSIKRSYLAITYGAPSDIIGTINAPVRHDPKDYTRMIVSHDREKAKSAITHYRLICSGTANATSLLECNLDTGRTHQIRVHMAYKKIPLIGDQKYGRGYNVAKLAPEITSKIISFPRQALHAWKIKFQHPTTEEIMEFTSEMPNDMKELGQAIGVLS